MVTRAFAAALWLLLIAGHAGAESRAPYVFSLRPNAGVGGGNVGTGGRIGGSAEAWPGVEWGVGAQLGTFLEMSGDLLGRHEEASGWFVGPQLALRHSPRGGYVILTLGAGYANVFYQRGGSGQWLCSDCPRPEHDEWSYSGFALNGALGWLAHPEDGAFEIGPVFRVDYMADPGGKFQPVTLFTLNLEIGFAIQSSSALGKQP